MKTIFFIYAFYFIASIYPQNIEYKFNNTTINYQKRGNIALAGFTPHPTKYLLNKNIKNFSDIDFSIIDLEEILDMNDFKDSLTKLIICCQNNEIDLLIFAFLPIYYSEMIQLFGLKNTQYIYENFMHAYVGRIINNYKDISKKLNYEGEIIVSIPPSNFLKDIPQISISSETRTSFLISQFPLFNFLDNEKYSILIINGLPSIEDRDIINNLRNRYDKKYEFSYKIDHINKKKFHKYL
jgi:hypothetical protein